MPGPPGTTSGTSIMVHCRPEDKYIKLDKPEPFEEDDNKKEPTPNTSFFSIIDVPVSVSLHSLQFSCSIDDCIYKFSTQTIISFYCMFIAAYPNKVHCTLNNSLKVYLLFFIVLKAFGSLVSLIWGDSMLNSFAHFNLGFSGTLRFLFVKLLRAYFFSIIVHFDLLRG